jgi:hypothetical protein
LSGFFSKDYILEVSFLGGWGVLILLIFFLSCSFSLVYSLRLFYFGLYYYVRSFTYFTFFSFKISIVFLFILFFWSIFWGFYLGCLIFLERFFFVFTSFKILRVALFLLSISIFFIVFFFKFSWGWGIEFSDYFFLYWFSGYPTSSVTGRMFNFSSFDFLWIEFFGPKSVYNFNYFSSYLLASEYVFYKIVLTSLGLGFLLFSIFSFFYLNRAFGLLLIGS